MIVVLLAVVAFFALKMVNSGGDTKTLQVPQFIGLNYSKDIKGNSEYSDFSFQITEQEFTKSEAEDKNYSDGDVIDQNPRAKTTIDAGTTVSLTLASVVADEEETNTVSVPSLAGKSYEDAQSALRAKGLKAKRTEKTSERSGSRRRCRSRFYHYCDCIFRFGKHQQDGSESEGHDRRAGYCRFGKSWTVAGFRA